MSTVALTPGLEVIGSLTRPDVEKFVSAQYIRGYLAHNYAISVFGGKVFCDYVPIGMGNDGQTTKLYLWALCLEYYTHDQTLESGSGISAPVVLSVERRFGEYRITDIKDDGQDSQFLKVNFPPEVQIVILHLHDPDNPNPQWFIDAMNGLSPEVEQEAKDYYGL